ncbi:hypothetical protein V8V91_20800 [Algoriphagus halophilus]
MSNEIKNPLQIYDVAYRPQIRKFQEELLQKAQKVVDYLGQSN